MPSVDTEKQLETPTAMFSHSEFELEAPSVLTGYAHPGYAASLAEFGVPRHLPRCDGTPHRPEIIHGPRLPIPEGAPWMVFEDIKVLHYQYTDWARMKSKQRWYQCWERVTFPAKRAVSIYRQYHHMDAAKDRAVEIDPAWVEEFEDYNASMLEADSASHYRWNEDVLAFLSERGVAPFRKLAIWDVNWADTSILGSSTSSMGLEDPRSRFDKLIYKWLQRTQPNARRMDVRIVQKLLQLIGW